MSKNNIQINIPDPCHKKFSEMIPAQGGSFCDSCEKIIIDFTSMTDQEIANAFNKNKGKICGQFRKDQLNRKINLTPTAINSYRAKAASILLSGVLTAGVANAQINTTTPQIIENQQITTKSSQMDKLKKEVNTSANQSKKFKFLIISESGEALIGATVHLKGDENIGGTTDIDGTATLAIPNSYLVKNSLTISVTYIGYWTQELEIKKNQFNSNQIFEVTLKEAILTGETVVIGYSISRPNTLYQVVKNWFNNFRYNREYRIEKREERKQLRKEKRTQRKLAKQIKKDNLSQQQSDSKIIKLPAQQYSISIKNISPNPFSNEINLEIYSKIKDDIQISLFNISGQKIYHVTQGVIKGNQNISLNLKNIKLADGEYILHIKEKNGQVQSRKMIRISE